MKNWGTQIFILIMLVTTISLVNATEASPNIQLNLDDSSIQITEEAELSVAISSQEIEMTKLKINWGDGENKELSIPSGNYLFLTTENHEYNDDGNFEISVEVYCGSERCSTQTTSIKINKPTDKDPNVELISPKKNADFEEDGVSFKFEATDDKELDNCVFELRMKNPKKKLEYSKEYEDIEENEIEVKFNLDDFESGSYTWSVTCEDNNSQDDTQSRSFTIETSKHEKEDEIEYLLKAIEDFQKTEDSLSLDEKQLLDELGISENLKYYKKRLLQIDQDLGNNIKFLSSESLKKEKTDEAYKELEEMTKTIPTSLDFKKNEEYIKNSLTGNMIDIVKNYLISNNIVLSTRKTKKLATQNIELQGKLSVSSEIKQAEIKYNQSTEEITFVKRTLKLNDPSIKKILEVFPDSFNEDIEFITDVKEIKDNMYEINIDDLEDNEILYKIKSDVKMSQLKQVDTLIFEKNLQSKGGITGMVISIGGDDSGLTFGIILVIVLGAVGFYLFYPRNKKLNTSNFKRSNEAREAIYLLNQAKTEIKKNSIEKPKENYHKIKELYSLLPEDYKQTIYSKIEELKIDIDKIEMRELIREYEGLKRHNPAEANEIYKKIKAKYTSLPQKYQQKIYERIIKY